MKLYWMSSWMLNFPNESKLSRKTSKNSPRSSFWEAWIYLRIHTKVLSEVTIQLMNIKATCENCKCKGKLFKRNQSGEVVLVKTDNFWRQEEDSVRYKKGILAPHGSSTVYQMINFICWGTLFWVTIMLIANYISLKNNRFKAGVGSRVDISAEKNGLVE